MREYVNFVTQWEEMMRNYNKKMFIIMSLSALLISGSYKVYAAQDTQIYKCISQNGQIAYQDYVCKKGSIVERMAFTASATDNNLSLRQHEISAIDHMHQRLHHERELNNKLRSAAVQYQHAPVPQQQTLSLHLHHYNSNASIDQRVNQNSVIIKK